MLEELKFCIGSVAKKEFIPALTHFVIKDSQVRGYNGVLTISSPIPFNIDCKPKAIELINAISNCEEEIHLSMTPAGKLRVKSGSYRVFVSCVQEEAPHPIPEGQRIDLNGEVLYKGLAKIAPIMGTDASRIWSNGILIQSKSMFATNNIILVQYWNGIDFGRPITIPRESVRQILRIGKYPLYAQLAENSLTLHYEDNRWLRTQLYDSSLWPNLSNILDGSCNFTPVDPLIFKGLEILKKSVTDIGAIHFQEGRMTTHLDEGIGGVYDIPGLPSKGKYNVEMLALIEGLAEKIDWDQYPQRCVFRGDKIRGCIIGMK